MKMDKIKEDVCFSCKNKSDIREVLKILQNLDERLERWERRMVQLDHVQRIAATTMNGVARVQKRNFDKMMEGFRAIHKGFRMACGAAVEAHEELAEHLGVCEI